MKRHLIWIALLLTWSVVVAPAAAGQPLTPADVYLFLPLDETAGAVYRDAGPGGNDASPIGQRSIWESDPVDMSGLSIAGPIGTGAIKLGKENANEAVFVGVSANSATLPGPGDDFTVAFWLKAADWAGISGVVADCTLNGMSWNVGTHSSSDVFTVASSFGSQPRLQTDIASLNGAGKGGQFVHFTAVFDHAVGVEQLYVDAVSPATTTNKDYWFFGNQNSFTVGLRDIYNAGRSNIDPLSGVDDFAVFRGKLDGTQVSDLRTNGAAAFALANPSIPMAVGYGFDETIGSMVHDSSGNGNDGAIIRYNGATYSALAVDYVTTPAVFGAGADLMEGAAKRNLEVAKTGDLPGPGDDFTVTFWLKVPNWETVSGVVADYDLNGIKWNIGFHSSVKDLVIASEFGADKRVDVEAADLPDGQFVHFAVSFDDVAGISKVYVNGELAVDNGGTTYWIVGTAGKFALGCRMRPAAQTHSGGVLDDFAIFRGELTQAQVRGIMQSGVAAAIPEPATWVLVLGAVLGVWLLRRRG